MLASAKDHRTITAEKRRLLMRMRLVDAAMSIFADPQRPSPVIDDIIREARVSRGSFYNYFDSLDAVRAAVGQEFNHRMGQDVLPVYDVLKEPWQRTAVGFRVFLVRAALDPTWAGLVTRIDAWTGCRPVVRHMMQDILHGMEAGQFSCRSANVASGFLMGASIHGIQAILEGMEDPGALIDDYVHTALTMLGCNASLCQRGMQFSSAYLLSWAADEFGGRKPDWALNLRVRDGRLYRDGTSP